MNEKNVKPRWLFIAMVLILIILAWKGLNMRKEIPSQEVIPLNRGIAVVTGSNYLIDKLQISLYENGVYKKMSYDERGVCVFEELTNNKVYTIKISRTDIKGMLLYRNLKINTIPVEGGSKYLVLVGASIGKAWKFENLPDRLNLGPEFVFGNRTKYDFDKSSDIEALTKLPVPVSGVIIKECAAYFPRDLKSSQKQIVTWATKLRSQDITTILATTVPVTEEHDHNHSGKFKSILEFNDFIRQYASKEGIAVLDLEKALRKSNEDRHLKNEYAKPDGLHLVKRAYDKVLDKIILPITETIK